MTSLSNLGIGLSLVFSLLLLALVAELYYLLWWKKKRIIQDEDDYSSSTSSSREFLYLFCWKKPSSLSSTGGLNPQGGVLFSDLEQENQLHPSKELYLNSFGGEDSIEAELMRLHNLSGPPRLLFTIKEETREDLESEDGRSRNNNNKVSRRSLADLLVAVETPFLTPMSSPRLLTPPLTPIDDSYNQNGTINPLFESSVDPEMYKLRPSPPPKFKFLKDAEDKFCKRRLLIEEEAALMKRVQKNAVLLSPTSSSMAPSNDSFTITVDKQQHKECEFDHHYHHHQNASQILPLSSSPSPSTIKKL